MKYLKARAKGSQSTLLKFIALLTILCGRCALLHAQFTSGSITGIVSDVSGAVIPNAAVTATSTTTNIRRTVLTDESGYFTISALEPGDYELTASSKNFQMTSVSITLTLGQVLRFNFALKVGTSSQTIEINAASSALALETQSHEVGNIVPAESVENLPASTGTVFSTLTAATNVQPYDSSTQFGDILTYNEGANSLTVGGTAFGTSSYLQDGVTNFNMFTKTANLQPSVEAVQEVSLVQNGASVRFDEPSVVNVITKSGTQQFHGRLYDYLRNDDLDAIGYYKTPKPPVRYNQFGANIGGPIVRNKLFFFFDYAGFRQQSSTVLYAIVPTNEERAGNFADSTVFRTNNTIYDPDTYNATTGTISPFPGNIIPTNRISSFATQFLKYYPTPTGSAIPGYNYQALKTTTASYDSYIGRLDYRIRDADMIYGAYETTDPNSVAPTFAATPIFNGEDPLGATNAYVQEVHTFGHGAVNIGRFGYNSSTVLSTIEGSGAENYVQEFGIQNINPTQAQYAPPSVAFTGHSSIGNPYAPQGASQKLFEFADEADWTLGKHSLVVGGEVDKLFFDGNWVIFQDGYFIFNGQYTTDHTAAFNGGNDLADFMLGLPAETLGSIGTTVGHFRQWDVFPYVQDDWRVSKRLTLNLGLRYDYYESPQDALGLASIYLYQTNPPTSHKGTFQQNYTNFAPRVGFAYSVNRNTVIHGGYGIYYSPFMYSELLYTLANPPNWVLQTNVNSLADPVNISDSFAPNPTVVSPWDTDLRMPTPRVQEFNLSVERSIGTNWIASMSYLGNLFAHTNMRYNPNQATVPTDPTNPSPIQSRRPYPWVQDVYQTGNIGYGNYNGGEAEIERRYSNGLSLLASYVWSKAMDIGSADNAEHPNGRDPSSGYGQTDYNLPQVFKLSSVYDLPFGAGRKTVGDSHWLNSQVIGGWQVSGAFSVESGSPFTVGSVDYSDTGAYHSQFANQVCDPNHGAPHTLQEWFNTSCLVQPDAGQIGDEQRNNVKGPRRTNLDASVFKTFRIHEGKSLQLRSDFFNAFNHPFLYIPVLAQAVQSPTYGQANVEGSRIIQLSLKFIY